MRVKSRDEAQKQHSQRLQIGVKAECHRDGAIQALAVEISVATQYHHAWSCPHRHALHAHGGHLVRGSGWTSAILAIGVR